MHTQSLQPYLTSPIWLQVNSHFFATCKAVTAAEARKLDTHHNVLGIKIKLSWLGSRPSNWRSPFRKPRHPSNNSCIFDVMRLQGISFWRVLIISCLGPVLEPSNLYKSALNQSWIHRSTPPFCREASATENSVPVTKESVLTSWSSTFWKRST